MTNNKILQSYVHMTWMESLEHFNVLIYIYNKYIYIYISGVGLELHLALWCGPRIASLPLPRRLKGGFTA